jgi:YndJ-like protein
MEALVSNSPDDNYSSSMKVEPQSNWAKASAISGAVAWAILLIIPTSPSRETELINRILLLGVLVIVPLGLALVATADREGRHSLPYRLALLLQPFGAIAVVVSLFLEQGWLAALFASLWLVVTALVALFGLWRLLPRGLRPAEEVSIDAGLIYLLVGGGWLVMSRLGAEPLGFGDTIVLLTAVHFHFAGFTAPILAGLAGRTISQHGPPRKLFLVAVVLIISGPPFVAAGITFSPMLALIGAAIISLGLVLLGLIVVTWVLRALPSWTVRILLGVSALSSFFAMPLACAYAYSIVARKLIVDIPQMAMTHGVINAFGFALCGFIAWSLAKPASRVASPDYRNSLTAR